MSETHDNGSQVLAKMARHSPRRESNTRQLSVSPRTRLQFPLNSACPHTQGGGGLKGRHAGGETMSSLPAKNPHHHWDPTHLSLVLLSGSA